MPKQVIATPTQTIELLDWFFDLIRAIQTSNTDGKVDWRDVPNFFPLAWKAPTAFGGIQNVTVELKDLSPSAKNEIMDFARQKFDLPDDELETLIEDTLNEGFAIYWLAQRWTARKK